MDELAGKITDSELEVMRVLWEAEGALPLSDIRQALQLRKGWESTTIKTLIQRLCAKKVLGQEKRNVFYYRPLISQQEYNAWATKNLVRKLYKGSVKTLVAALVQADELTVKDVEELQAMFREHYADEN